MNLPRLLFSITATIFLMGPLLAQNNLLTGPIVKTGKSEISSFFGSTNGNFFFAGNQDDKKDFTIYQFDDNLKLTKEKLFETEYRFIVYGLFGDTYDGIIFPSISTDNKLNFIRRNYKAKAFSGLTTYLNEVINIDGLMLESNSTQISEQSVVTQITAFSRRESGTLRTAESPDGQKRVIITAGKNYSGDNVSFQVISLDMANAVNWTSEIVPNQSGSYYSITEIAIDNSGGVYVLSALTPDKNTLDAYELRKYESDGSLSNKIEFTPNGYIFSAPFLFTRGDNTLVLTGFSSKSRTNDIDGVSFFKFDGNLQEIVKKTHPFPAYFSEKSKSIKNGVLDQIGRVECISTPNGSYAMAVDFGQIFISDGSGRNEDLFSIQLDAEGNISKSGLLIKEQAGGSTSLQFGSFRLLSHENEVFVFYQDNPKNADLAPDQKGKKTYMNSYSSMFKIKLTDTGFGQKELVYNSKKDKLRTPMHKIFKLSNGNILFCEEAKNVNRLRIFSFE